MTSSGHDGLIMWTFRRSARMPHRCMIGSHSHDDNDNIYVASYPYRYILIVNGSFQRLSLLTLITKWS